VLAYQFNVNLICLLSAGCDVARQLNSACNLRHSTDSVIYGDVVVALEQFGLRTKRRLRGRLMVSESSDH